MNVFTKVDPVQTHYTIGAENVTNAGCLLSTTQLKKIGLGYLSSSKADISSLSNGDYVFFRLELKHDQTKPSRFGNQHFVLDGRESGLLDFGWVSMGEMYWPLAISVFKHVSYNRETIREVFGGYQDGQLTFKYPSGKCHPFDLFATSFYGHDIMPGIALVLIREFRRIGGDFREHALSKLDTESLNRTLASLVRVEAKIPSRVLLANQKWRLFESKQGGQTTGEISGELSSYKNLNETYINDQYKNSLASNASSLFADKYMHTFEDNKTDILFKPSSQIDYIYAAPLVSTSNDKIYNLPMKSESINSNKDIYGQTKLPDNMEILFFNKKGLKKVYKEEMLEKLKKLAELLEANPSFKKLAELLELLETNSTFKKLLLKEIKDNPKWLLKNFDKLLSEYSEVAKSNLNSSFPNLNI